MRLRVTVPLLGHIVPTVVIGYGVVIPGSPIAGFNEYTVGFAASIASSAVSYLVGVRMAANERS
jgi:hypothetical protein